MRFSQLVKRLRWFTAVLASFTMAFSPLASAKESEKISRAQIENYLNVTGLNKNTTWGQFFDKTKDSYPEEVAQKIEEFVKLNPNLPMPQVKLKSAQNSQGGEAAVLEVFDNGKTYTIQVIGESDKWAKISGLTLKESDLQNPANGLVRLQTGNIFFKKEADKLLAKHNLLPDPKLEEIKANLSLFTSFPRMTPQLWSSMTKSQRKGFIKQIADVWLAAEKVLNTPESPQENKTSLLENYIRFFLMSEAEANTTSQQQTIDQMVRELSSNQELLRAYQSGVWSAELDRWLVQFEVSAERRAQNAISQCQSRVTSYMNSRDVQMAECAAFGRQLMINESVISQFRSRACRAPAQYIGSYAAGEQPSASRDQKDALNRRDINSNQEQLCACPDSNVRVTFNDMCPAAGSVASVQPAQAPAPVEPFQSPVPSPAQSRRGGLSGFWPLAIGGAAIGVLAGLLFFGKDKNKSRTTANTASTAPAACPANQVGTPPSCSCGPCTAPQQVYNFVTCQCTNVTSNVICPNNEMAPNGDSSKCPKCSDGTYRTTEPCPQAQPVNCVGANCGGVRPAIQ